MNILEHAPSLGEEQHHKLGYGSKKHIKYFLTEDSLLKQGAQR